MSNASLRLRGAVKSRMHDHAELLEALVSIPSHASTPGGTDRVASLLLPRLESLGFAFRTVPQRPVVEDLRWVEAIMSSERPLEDLGPSYRGSREGPRPGATLLLGDLDTSYPQDAHEAFPIRREGSLVFGPGVADMKGGLVTMLAAIQALDDLELPTQRLEIVLSGDEQAGSLGSRAVIESAARSCRVTLCFECARRGGKLMAGRGHIGVGDITVTGHEAHAGSAYEEGVNAVDLLARVIPPIDALSRPELGILVTVTLIEGGRRRSVIPGHARAVLDIRTPSAAAWEATVGAIERIVSEVAPERATVRTFAHRPGVVWSRETSDLLATIKRVAEPLDVRIEAFRSPAAGSSAFAANAGSVVMDGMGPEGGGLMTQAEHIDVDTIATRAAIAAATILESAG